MKALPDLYGIITPEGAMFGHSSSRGKAEAHATQSGNTAVRYIPAPAWLPIAELPEEWRDGRWIVIAKTINRNTYMTCARYDADRPGTGLRDDIGSSCPGYTHYLHLDLKEAPNA